MDEMDQTIRNLMDFIKTKKIKKKKYEKMFAELKKYLLKIFIKKYCKLKKYSDECLSGLVFKLEYEEKTYKEWLKYQLVIMLEILEEINNKIIQDFSNGEKELNDLFNFLDEFLSDLIIFLQDHSVFLLDKKVDFGHCKANVAQAQFIYIGIDTFLYKNLNDAVLDKKFLLHLNIFSLRQAIELRCKEILGIYSITNKTNKVNKNFMGNKLIQIIKKHSSKVKLPLAITIIENIYEWSNSYIHAGYKPPIWQVAFAHKISRDFFMPHKIEIDKRFYNDLEKIINTENIVKITQFPKPLGDVKLL